MERTLTITQGTLKWACLRNRPPTPTVSPTAALLKYHAKGVENRLSEPSNSVPEPLPEGSDHKGQVDPSGTLRHEQPESKCHKTQRCMKRYHLHGSRPQQGSRECNQKRPHSQHPPPSGRCVLHPLEHQEADAATRGALEIRPATCCKSSKSLTNPLFSTCNLSFRRKAKGVTCPSKTLTYNSFVGRGTIVDPEN